MALSPDPDPDPDQGITAQRPQVTVSARGVRVLPRLDEAVDVFIGDHRVWSFNPAREAADDWAVWPSQLGERLDGVVSWSVRRHVGAQVLASGELAVGGSTAVVAVVDDDGRRLAIDKAGRLARVFAHSDAEQRDLLVETLTRALDDLRHRGGAEAFLAFGCLLGAVRDGRMIGHDKDADVGVLCPSPYPVDVARQSFRLERLMRSLGWRTRRWSGGNFKVFIELADGSSVGIDTFSAWYDLEGLFHLMPNVRASLPMESLLPVGSVTLEGREVVAPRDPVPLLAATYGPGWSVPDPAFHYDTPAATAQRLTGWFRGERQGLTRRERYCGTTADHPAFPEPSEFARWVLPRLTPGADVVDLGCGTGCDSFWFAERGRRVEGLDYSKVALDQAAVESRRRIATGTAAVPTFASMNLHDLRQVLATGARLAASPRAVDVYARFVADSVSPSVRLDLWRLLDMAGRSGGRSFVEARLQTRGGRRDLDAQALLAAVEQRDGVVVEQLTGRGLAVRDEEDPMVCRLVVEWRRS